MTLSIQKFFIPAVRLEVPGFSISNLDSTGLRMEWSLNRDNTNKPDEGEIIIYNLSPVVAGSIYNTWKALNAGGVGAGMSVVFSIGWDRLPKRVFVGDVWNMIPSDRTPTDTLTILQVGDGNRKLRDSVVGRDFSNVKIDVVLDYLVELPPAVDDVGGGGLGLIYSPTSKALVKQAASEITLQSWGNIPKGANVREAIDLIMETLGLEWRVHNGEFVAMRGGVSQKPGPILRPSTGLLGYSPRNDGGIIARSLAIPETEPGMQVQVQDNLGIPVAEPVHRVERVSFAGSTDGDSLMSVEAARAQVL